MDNIINSLHPNLQLTIQYLANPKLSFSQISKKQGISKQAMHKKIQHCVAYLLLFHQKQQENNPTTCNEIIELKNTVKRLKSLVLELQRLLVLKSAKIYLLLWFKEKVLAFLPHFKLTRLDAWQKVMLLDLAAKFKRSGGKIQDFCKAIGRSSETLLKWKRNYEKYGISGLKNKTTRPKNFGNKITSWVKIQLVALIVRYPHWTDYQYHKYIKMNPTTQYCVS